jgi:HSP20 family protein
MTDNSRSVEVKGAGKAAPASQPFISLRSQIDRLFDDFSNMFDRDPFSKVFPDMPRFPALKSEIGAVMPAVDMVEDEKSYRVTAELPGISQKDVEVTMEGGLLTIKGEKKEEREEKEKGFYLSERRYGSFQRSLRLPDGLDEGKIEAKFDNGVLTVVLPKSPEAISKPKKIEVKAK